MKLKSVWLIISGRYVCLLCYFRLEVKLQSCYDPRTFCPNLPFSPPAHVWLMWWVKPGMDSAQHTPDGSRLVRFFISCVRSHVSQCLFFFFRFSMFSVSWSSTKSWNFLLYLHFMGFFFYIKLSSLAPWYQLSHCHWCQTHTRGSCYSSHFSVRRSLSWHRGDEIANVSALFSSPLSISHWWADHSQSIMSHMKPSMSGPTKGSTHHVSLSVQSSSSKPGLYSVLLPQLDLQVGGYGARTFLICRSAAL